MVFFSFYPPCKIYVKKICIVKELYKVWGILGSSFPTHCSNTRRQRRQILKNVSMSQIYKPEDLCELYDIVAPSYISVGVFFSVSDV